MHKQRFMILAPTYLDEQYKALLSLDELGVKKKERTDAQKIPETIKQFKAKLESEKRNQMGIE